MGGSLIIHPAASVRCSEFKRRQKQAQKEKEVAEKKASRAPIRPGDTRPPPPMPTAARPICERPPGCHCAIDRP